MPAAISPTAASRCCSRASRSSFLMSVTSWNVNRKPARPPGVWRCVARQADVDLARPSGRSVPELERAGAPPSAARESSSSRDSARGQLQDLRDAAGRRPTATAVPVMVSAARLNVRMRRCRVGRREPARQAVDDVLVERLQVGDLGRRLLEPRARALQPSASEPLSNATEKNRNTLRPVVYATMRSGGSVPAGSRHGTAEQPGRARSTASARCPAYSSALSVATSRPPRRNCTLLAATIGST